MKHDINNIEDIKLLVDSFYGKVKTDDVIGYFFNDIAKVDWSMHLPKMYSFWNSILFGEGSFKGNPMVTHILLNKKEPLEEKHFKHWQGLFFSTVDELFEGNNAAAIKQKAANIAGLMSFKVSQTSNNPLFIQ